MICPICKTNNTKNQDAEFCAQCGSDTYVHRLLQGVRAEMDINEEIKKVEQTVKKTSNLFMVFQAIPSILIFVCMVFGIFIGIRFLTFLDRVESLHASMSTKWSETSFEQLQQMNIIIKQELDLILDQRRENQALQAKIQTLTTQQSSTLSIFKDGDNAL